MGFSDYLSDEESQGGNGTSLELLDTSKEQSSSGMSQGFTAGGIGFKSMDPETLESICKKSLWQTESVYEVMGKDN